MRTLVLERPENLLSEEVWSLSRHEGSATLDEILKIDAPVNDFPSIVINITSTIIEREVFSTMRDHVMWARTSRVDDIKEFVIADCFYDGNESYYEEIREEMISSNRSQDEYRMMLPLVAVTKYTVRISMRSLFKVSEYFAQLSIESKEPRTKKLFSNAHSSLKRIVHKYGYAMAEYSNIEIFKEISDYGFGKIGDVYTTTALVNMSMRAQMVRCRLLSISDSVWSTILPNLNTANQGSSVLVQVSADKETWKQLVKKRSCWLAQQDLWSPIISEVSGVFGFKEDSLPCSDGSCPFSADAMIRTTDKDPGAPCPRWLKINAYENLSYKKEINLQIESEHRPNFWREMI